MKRIFLILILSLLTVAAFSQGNNSVNITVLGCGNYSAKLSDYYSPKNAGMITIILRNNDLKEPVLPIQLYMSVTNNGNTYIQTKSPNLSKIFQLHAGEVLTLTGQDLECIFNTYYLNYNKSNLKDGHNILKIYARDTRTGKIVSNTAQILLKSVMIAPPKLTSPDDNFTIETDNQFINFTWRGDNGGANIATRCNYRYKFELWKQNINDKNIEAQRFADFTADNLFDEKYQFLLSTFPFEIGKKYCWRVTAYDPLEKATFLQNGKSEVRNFIYKHLPVPVTNVKHTINERTRQATFTWNAEEGHTKYYVEYYNPQTTKTIAMESDVPQFTTANAPKQEYKIFFRVKAQCWGDDSRCSDWTDWDTVKFAAPQIVKPKYPCGYQFPKVEITNFELKTDFKEGDTVSEANGSSDYEIINCKSDESGVLQGQFYLIMNAWGGAKIACEFWDTKINTDNQIITTRYRSIDTPGGMVEPEELANFVKSLWLDGNSLATSSKIKDTIVIDQKFDYLYRRESGEFVAVVVNNDGSTTETEFDLHKNPSQTLITDGKGDSLVYSQNGHVMGIKEYRATGGNAALLKDYHRRSDSLAQWQINFLPYSEQTYAFDYLGSGNHGIYSSTEYYPSVNGYDFRYKSVECYKTDKVIVDFGSYPEKDSVIFKDKYGVQYKLSKGNVLNFTGVAKPDTNYIYAYRGDEKIGKLSVNTYKQKTYKVVLVSVNKANLPDISKVIDCLHKVYKQAVDTIEIETDELTVNGLDKFSHGGSGVLTVYNDDQKTVLRAYDSEMKNGVYYLFFIDNVTDKKDGNGTMISGYMPRGYNAGFIYDGGSLHTIAHELGHGIAGLEHVFENSNNSGKTANLMDYSSGEELWHFQWDEIQDPSRVWMKWNKDEEEGENVEKLNPLIRFKIKGNKTKEYEYENGGLFATMYTNDKITIEIISKDTTLNIRNISCFFDKNKLSSIDSLNNKVELTLDEKTISLKGNLLSIKDSLNKEIASLKFQAYLPPYVEFSIKENERGEFLWDDSFRRINKSDLYNPTRFFADYDHNLTVGKDNHKYYAPVLGLQQNQSADILLNFMEFDKLITEDKNFKIMITAENPAIMINGNSSFEINNSNIEQYCNKKGTITIEFTKILQKNKEDTIGVMLYAIIPALNKRVGLIECFCRTIVEKSVTLIYVRFSKKDSYPLFNSQKFESYLNTYSFNQLFRKFTLKTKYLDAFIDESDTCFKQLQLSTQENLKKKYNINSSSLSSMSDSAIFMYCDWHNNIHKNLLLEQQKDIRKQQKKLSDTISNDYKKLNSKFNLLSSLFAKSTTFLAENEDYYFITDIRKGNVGGFHHTGYTGGVRLVIDKALTTKYNETDEVLNAHELGHWLGLPHVFESNKVNGMKIIRFTNAKTDPGQSIDNFMDYNVFRKSWFKNQLINVK